MLEAKLISGNEKGLVSVATELKFPPRDSSSELPRVYKELDHWDQQMASELGFESLEEKFLFRRVSGRYVNMIQSHCRLLADLIKSSEETDVDYNGEVISFSLRLHKGKLPG